MGEKKRGEYLRDNGITITYFLPERVYSRNGIKAKPRKHTPDFSVLFYPREEEVKPYLTMRDNETFVDVGANVGQYCLKIARDYIHKGVKVIAIEAHPDNYKALCRNISLNDFKNITAINMAVSDHKGIVPMYQPLISNHYTFTGNFTICKSMGKSLEQNPSLQVECDTLDSILSGLRVDVMKMDIEGAEIQALIGGTRVLKQLRKVIIEIHENNFEIVNQILQSNNFKTKTIPSTVIKELGYVIGLK